MYIAVDLGGSKILGALFENGEIIETNKKKTKANLGTKVVTERIFSVIDDLVSKADVVEGIGIIVPGLVENSRKIITCTNVPLDNVPFADLVEEKYKCKCILGNDVDLAIYGEYMSLDDRPNNVVGIFVGTGIGGGLIFNGNLYTGSGFTAEIGHVVVEENGKKCGCGNKGCFEAYASKTAMLKKINKERKKGRKSILIDKLDKEDMIKSSLLKEAYDKNDELAHELVMTSCRYIGRMVGMLSTILTPDVFIFGGGIIESFREEMTEKIKIISKRFTLKEIGDNLDIRISKLGDNAGITGAYYLIKEEVESEY